MLAGYSWNNEKLFFFDKGKKKRWQKRQKKPTDSLPITLLRDVRAVGGVPGNRSDTRNKKELTFIKEGEEDPGGQNENILPDEQHGGLALRVKRRNQVDFNLDDDDDEDTQKFLYEEAKFSAPSLLAQIEKFLVILSKFRSLQRHEIQQLNEEIETVYGEHWRQNAFEERSGTLDISDELYHKLCLDFEQLAVGTVYTKREWQTSVYRELAALHDIKNYPSGDFLSLASSPDAALKGFNLKIQSAEQEKSAEADKKSEKSDTHKMLTTSAGTKDNKSHASNSDLDVPPILTLRRESRNSVMIPKPKTRGEKYRYFPDKDKAKTGHSKINVGPHDSFNDDESSKTWEVNLDKNYLLLNQGQTFLPGSVINFSMTSKTCRDKGWINRQDGTEDLEHKSVLEWARMRLKLAIKQKEDEEEKAKLVNEDGPFITRNYGDSKRETTIKYKQGVSWAKFLSKKKSDVQKRFLTVLPDGSTCCYYQSGRVAVVTCKCSNNPGFYTFVFSDEILAKMLACFTPTGRGCCNYSEKSVKFLVTNKQAFFFDQNGAPTKKWKWAYGKLMSPETIQLNEHMSVRCVSQTSMTLYVHIEGEATKFQVALTNGASEPDSENLGLLVTGEQFTSNAASQSLFQKKKLTREEKKAKIAKKEAAKLIASGLSEECLAERRKELEEKFPERKEIETDAPFLLELYRLQRKVKNVIFDWMEHYRLATGISRPSKMKLLMKKKQRQNSANSLPGALPSTEDRLASPTPRAPSAPPIPRLVKTKLALLKIRPSRSPSHQRPKSTDVSYKETAAEFKDIKIDVPPKTAEGNRTTISLSPILSNTRLNEVSTPRTPRSLLLPKEGCPVALRSEMLGDNNAQCRCDKRRMPYVTDTEYDLFITERVSQTQLIVVSIVSSRFPRTPCDGMLDELYYERNKTHTFPCVQCRYESYRLLRYDMATASGSSEVPLLLRRHNVAPGMFLMYVGGRLLFADHIFNGYGNAKRDFLKQVLKTQKDSMKTSSLALDFRFSPSPSRRGPRTAWGGEIGAPLLVNVIGKSRILEIEDFSRENELPALISAPSETSDFSEKERERRRDRTAGSFFSFGILSKMQR